MLFRKSGASLRAEAEEAELKAQKLAKSVEKLEAEHARKVKALEEAAAKAKVFKAELAKAAVQFTQSSPEKEKEGADTVKKPLKNDTQEKEEKKGGGEEEEKEEEEKEGTEKDTEEDDTESEAAATQEGSKKTQIEKYMASIRADLAEDKDIDKDLLGGLPQEALETLLALPEDELGDENRTLVEEFKKAIQAKEATEAAARAERERARADTIREMKQLEAAENAFVEQLRQDASAAAEAVVRRHAKAQAAEVFAKIKWEEVKRVNSPLGPGVESGKPIAFWQAADVYSAGLLLWELWFRCAPYGDVNDPFKIGALVCEGARPQLQAKTKAQTSIGGADGNDGNAKDDDVDDDPYRPFTPPGARPDDPERLPPPPPLRDLLVAMWHPDPYLRPSADFAAQCVLQGCAPTDLDPGFGYDKRTAKGRLDARKAEAAAKQAAAKAGRRGGGGKEGAGGAAALSGRAPSGRQASVDLTDRFGRGSLGQLDSASLRHHTGGGGALQRSSMGSMSSEPLPQPLSGATVASTQRMTLLPSWTPDYHALNPNADDDNNHNEEDNGPAEVVLDPTIEALLGRLGLAVPARRASAMPGMPATITQAAAAAAHGTSGAPHNGNNSGSSSKERGGGSGGADVATGGLLELGYDADQYGESGAAPALAEPPAMNFEGMDPETVALLTRLNFRGSATAATMAYRPETATPPLPPPPEPMATTASPPLLPPSLSNPTPSEKNAESPNRFATVRIDSSDDISKAGSSGGGGGEGGEGNSGILEPAMLESSLPPPPMTLPILPPPPMSASEPPPPPPLSPQAQSMKAYNTPPEVEEVTAVRSDASSVKEGPCEVAGIDDNSTNSRSRSRRLLAYTARWAPATGELELVSTDTGTIIKSFKVKVGSAVDRGKAGPLGRKFKVSFESADGEPSTTMVVPREDAPGWVAALNGSSIREESAARELSSEEIAVGASTFEDNSIREVSIEEIAVGATTFEDTSIREVSIEDTAVGETPTPFEDNVDERDSEMSFDDL